MSSRVFCIRKLEFDAAHRVMGHENKCKYLHGHRYKIEAYFEAKSLDNIGRVIDFGQIKEILGDWVNNNWDHTTILCKEDNELGNAISLVTNQKIYYIDSNPTAENMALYLLNVICPSLFKDEEIQCKEIILHETPNCFVKVTS